MATTVPDCEIDRFLSAALPGASRVPTRSGRNGYFSADATGRTCPKPAIAARPAQRRAWVSGSLAAGRYFDDLVGADERQ